MTFARILCSENLSHQLCQNSLFQEISIWITNWSFTAPLCIIQKCKSDQSNQFSFQKKHTTSQIAEQVATYFSSTVLSAMQDSILPNKQPILDLKLKKQPKLLFLSMALPIRINITMQVSLLICIILESILNCTLQVSHCMLCNQVSMSQIRRNILRSFIGKHVFGLVFVRHINKKII